MRRFVIGHAIALLLLLSAPPMLADQPASDANLVTALDLSSSIMRHEEWLEFEGLAKAVTSAAFLEAVAGGRHGRIGFAVFTWSSGGRPALLVPWTGIATIDDPRRVAAALRRKPRIDRGWRDGSEVHAVVERRTDISAALDLALDLLLSAPYRAPRSVVNICTNGEARLVRDRVRRPAACWGGDARQAAARSHRRGPQVRSTAPKT